MGKKSLGTTRLKSDQTPFCVHHVRKRCFYYWVFVPGPPTQPPRSGASIEARPRSSEEPEPRHGNFFTFWPNSEPFVLCRNVLKTVIGDPSE